MSTKDYLVMRQITLATASVLISTKVPSNGFQIRGLMIEAKRRERGFSISLRVLFQVTQKVKLKLGRKLTGTQLLLNYIKSRCLPKDYAFGLS
jgi:hypothetical protein